MGVSCGTCNIGKDGLLQSSRFGSCQGTNRWSALRSTTVCKKWSCRSCGLDRVISNNGITASLQTLPLPRVIRLVFIGTFSGLGRVEQRMHVGCHAGTTSRWSRRVDTLEGVSCAGKSPAAISAQGRWRVVVC